MELLVWHEALGSDDEQATEDELAARLLYAYSSCDVEAASASDAAQARGMHALHFMEALVAFTRLLCRQQLQADAAPRWISAALHTRRFFICEFEPQIYFALGVPFTETNNRGDLRVVHEAVLQEVYDTFRLFYGSVDYQLRQLPSDEEAELPDQFADGMALLHHIGSVRRRLRKIAIAQDLNSHDKSKDTADDDTVGENLQQEASELERELASLLVVSPHRLLWQRCETLLPKLLRVMGAQRLSMFHEIDGVAFFPMDETTFLALQTLVNSLLVELQDLLEGGVALFYRGNVLWRTMEAQTMHTLQKYLRYREQDGMDAAPAPARGSASQVDQSSLWMPRKYDNAFSTIWASKTTYAECAIVAHIAPQPRHATRSLHKQTSSSLSSIVNELASGGEGTGNSKPAATQQIQILRGQRYRFDAPVYRNRGFLARSGYFLPSWELAKPESKEVVWAPTIHQRRDHDKPLSTALVYHESDLSILMLVAEGTNRSATLQHMERIETCLEKLQLTPMANMVFQRFLAMTGNSPSREKPSSSQPPFVYLNRVNLAFKADQIPRLIKTKEVDHYPRPGSLWARYLPTSSLELLNESHAILNGDRESVELRVKTVHDGWLVARRSNASRRELYAFFDTKAASIADAQDALTDLFDTQFSNIFH